MITKLIERKSCRINFFNLHFEQFFENNFWTLSKHWSFLLVVTKLYIFFIESEDTTFRFDYNIRLLNALPLKRILQYDRTSATSRRHSRARVLKLLYVCVAILHSYIRTCVRGRISPPYESLIFISKNFFNKKVVHARASPPARSRILYSDGFSRTGRCISYIRERRGPTTPDRGALKVSPGARDIS